MKPKFFTIFGYSYTKKKLKMSDTHVFWNLESGIKY